MSEPWWLKPLSELDVGEWEALCDGCGRCCLNKLEDEETGELLYTRAACRLLDIAACRCTRYADRRREVPTCMNLYPDFQQFHWLPPTCAYRLRAEDQPLPSWHPLVTGSADTVHQAGISVRHFAISELAVDDLEDEVIQDFEPH